ncbi:MAG: rhomboid family intramembrane serine protease [Bacteroidota bacterium]
MSYEQFRPTGFSMLPVVVKNLLIINGLFFLATLGLKSAGIIDLDHILGMHYFNSPLFKPYQLVSYMFMHATFWHLFFNMFALWMFGYILENVWGPKKFLLYYMVTGLGAIMMQMAVNYFQISHLEASMSADQISMVMNDGYKAIMQDKNFIDPMMGELNGLINGTTIGASGSVFGILLAFGMLFPNTMIYVYFAIPIKAKWFVIIYGAIELISGVVNVTGDNVAHFAHLGGMLFGFILIMIWRKKDKKRNLYEP